MASCAAELSRDSSSGAALMLSRTAALWTFPEKVVLASPAKEGRPAALLRFLQRV